MASIRRLVVGAALVCLLPACRPGQTMEPTEVAPELKLERVHFRVWRGETLRARGEARQVTIRRDTGQAHADDLVAELPAAGEPIVITAPAAQGDLTRQVFAAQGGVVVTHADQRAETERARYGPGPSGKGWVDGDAPVTVHRGTMRFEGTGFTFDPQSGDLVLRGPVTTRTAGGER